MVGLILFAVLVRIAYHNVDLRLIDNAAVNLISIAMVMASALILWSWFVFWSGYSNGLRRFAFVGALLLVGAGVACIRPESFSGNMIPKGWRFAWQPAMRQRFEVKPVVVAKSEIDIDLGRVSDADFAGFLGTQRTNYISSAKLSRDWTNQPPKEIWRKPIGRGWSGFATVNGFAVTMEQHENEEWVTCYRVSNGDLMWAHKYAARHQDTLGGLGPRSTPTIHEGKVYTLGATGKVFCLDGATGKPIWSDDLLVRYKFPQGDSEKRVQWGRAGSILIYKDLAICPAGGAGDKPKSLVAYNKVSGKVVWEGGESQVGYTSPVLMTLGGEDQIVSVNESDVTGHNPANGAVLWKFEWFGSSSANANCSQPHAIGNDQIFLSKGYGQGCAVIQLEKSQDQWKVKNSEPVWSLKGSLKTKFTNVTIIDGAAYGLCDGVLESVDLKAGKSNWRNRKGTYGHGQVLGAGKNILVLGEEGDLAIVDANPREFNEYGRFAALGGDSNTWNNLCLTKNLLLIRNSSEAACYELATEE